MWGFLQQTEPCSTEVRREAPVLSPCSGEICGAGARAVLPLMAPETGQLRSLGQLHSLHQRGLGKLCLHPHPPPPPEPFASALPSLCLLSSRWHCRRKGIHMEKENFFFVLIFFPARGVAGTALHFDGARLSLDKHIQY